MNYSLATGGGHGFMARRYGLTVDNLLAAEIVLADGSVRVVGQHSTAQDDIDLFWAMAMTQQNRDGKQTSKRADKWDRSSICLHFG